MPREVGSILIKRPASRISIVLAVLVASAILGISRPPVALGDIAGRYDADPAELPVTIAAPASTALDPLLDLDPDWREATLDSSVEVLLLLPGPSVYDRWREAGGDPVAATFAARTALDLTHDDGRISQTDSAAQMLHAAPVLHMESFEAVVSAEQAPLTMAVDAAGGTVLGRYDSVANALLVRAPRAAVELLAERSDVSRVLPAPRLELATRNSAVPAAPLALGRATDLIGANAAAAQGWTGRGVTIAIVDSGIDYNHRSLGGSGDYASNDPDVVEEGTFPTAKVVGGYDFAGTAYTGSGAPRPDDDPLDESGHGTHVAGIAAGVAAGGVANGVARDASLVALKLFGRRGSTNLVLHGLQWILDARLGREVAGTPAVVDIVNLSLGSPWTAGVMEATGAFSRLEDAGVLVVAAAGNDGQVAFVIGGPAAVPGVLAVGSTNGPGGRSDMVRVHDDEGVEDIEAVEANSGLAPGIAVVGRVRAPLASGGRGCSGDPPVMSLQGRVALLARGTCTFLEKLTRAQAEGAVAALVYDEGRGLVQMGSDSGSVSIPAFMIPLREGEVLRARLSAGQLLEAELSPAFRDGFERLGVIDTVSSFSSRGPTRTGALAPDLSAPGAGIAAPAIGSTSGAVVLSGTSMASPVVAGAAAVLVQRLRAASLYGVGGALLGPRDAMALLVTTTAPAWMGDARDGRRAAIAHSGAGRVDVLAAIGTGLVARAGEIASVNMGVHALTDRHVDEATLRLINLRPQSRRFKLDVHWPDHADAQGVSWRPDPSIVELAPRATGQARLRLVAVAAEMRPYGVADGMAAMNGNGRLHEPEHDALLVVTEVGPDGEPLPAGDTLHVPLWLFARSAANVSARGVGGGASTSFEVRNDGPQTGSLELFTVLGQDNVGDAAGWLDVDWVGARVVDGAEAGASRVLEILVHTREARRVPYERSVTLRLDLNGDGAADVRVAMEDAGLLASGGADPRWNGRLVTAASTGVVGPGGSSWDPHLAVGVDVSARYVVLRLDAARLGFADGAPISFNASLSVDDRFGGARGDEVGRLGSAPLVFDEARPRIAADRWSMPVSAGASIPLQLVSTGAAPATALALVAANVPDADLIVLEAAPGPIPPLAGPLPTATVTPLATWTTSAPPLSTLTATSTATPDGLSTADANPTPTVDGTTTPDSSATPEDGTPTDGTPIGTPTPGTPFADTPSATPNADGGGSAPTAGPLASDTPGAATPATAQPSDTPEGTPITDPTTAPATPTDATSSTAVPRATDVGQLPDRPPSTVVDERYRIALPLVLRRW